MVALMHSVFHVLSPELEAAFYSLLQTLDLQVRTLALLEGQTYQLPVLDLGYTVSLYSNP
jgi:hypothetical protein